MFSLITTLISIALMAGTLYAGISYINYDKYDELITENSLTADFYNYDNIISTYKKVFNVYPATDTWEDDLSKIKVLKPSNNKGLYSYEYDTVNYSVAVCRKETLPVKEYQSVKLFQKKGLTILSTDCFAKSNTVIDESGSDVTYALTMWVHN